MLKRILLLLFTTLVVATASAYDFTIDGLGYNINSDGKTVTVYKGDTEPSGALVIPSTVKYSSVTYSVTEIGYSAFYGCSGLTSVTIGNSVQTIGEAAFFGCSGLTSVTIGNSVTAIGYQAFYNCSGLTSVTIPNSVTTIGGGAFACCSGLTSLTIGNSVQTIGEAAFSGCSGLTSVTIPNSVMSIGDRAFYECSGLTSVTIPNSVTSIGSSAFSGCSGLTSVTIGNSVTSIGSSAFSGCSGLTSVKWNAKNCLNDGFFNDDYYNSLFSGLTGIKTFIFGNEVESIPIGLCSGLSGLTNVTIPNSVLVVGDYAFYGCSGLTSVTIGNSVTEIGPGAFYGCSGLTSVKWNAKNCLNDGFFNDDYYNSPFSGLTGIKTFIFGNEVESIPIGLCYGLTGLTSVTIPNSVIVVGDYAFYGCSGLTSVTIGNSVKMLRSLTYPDELDDISMLTTSTFQGCTNLRTVTNLSVKPQSIDFSTFRGVNLFECELLVPAEALERYEWAYYWNEFGTIRAIDTTKNSDINGDGSVNTGDVSALYKAVLNGTTDAIYDLNGDDSVNTGDVSTLYKTILGN